MLLLAFTNIKLTFYGYELLQQKHVDVWGLSCFKSRFTCQTTFILWDKGRWKWYAHTSTTCFTCRNLFQTSADDKSNVINRKRLFVRKSSKFCAAWIIRFRSWSTGSGKHNYYEKCFGLLQLATAIEKGRVRTQYLVWKVDVPIGYFM